MHYDILIKNATIFYGSEFDRLDAHDVAIVDGTIIAMEQTIHATADCTIDGSNFFATPGFTNAHFHPAQQLNRAVATGNGHDHHMDVLHATDRFKSSEQVKALAYIAFLEGLRSGTTTFQCVGSDVEGYIDCIRDMGIRAVCVPILKDLSNEQKTSQVRAIAHETDACIEKAHGIFCAHHSELIRVHFGVVNVRYASDELITQMKQLADQHDAGFHMHVAESAEYVAEVLARTGHRPVEHLAKLETLDSRVSLAHAVHLDPTDIELLREHGCHVIHCPRANSYLGVGVCPVLALMRAGVNVALGSDAAINNNSNEIRGEARAASDKLADHHGRSGLLGAKTLFKMLTVCGARALCLGDRLGTISIGHVADIVLWRRLDLPFLPGHDLISDLVFTDSCRAHTVIINGQIVLDRYKSTRIDEEAIIELAFELSREYELTVRKGIVKDDTRSSGAH